jgi:hypothetical protein
VAGDVGVICRAFARWCGVVLKFEEFVMGVVEQVQVLAFSEMLRGLPQGFLRVKRALQFFDGRWVTAREIASMTGLEVWQVAAEFGSLHDCGLATKIGAVYDAKCRWDGEPGGEAP